ncbi:MAG: reverse transcriptase family protein, partial [Kangiellaceae bacterium]|nr:reverse transcriptase family protein [Kangiellaceae bacterium]
MKNDVMRLMRSKEKEYYHELFERFKKDSKRSWSIIRELVRSKSTSSASDKFNINGTSTSDENVICNAFNDFFVNVGLNISSQIPPDDTDPCTFIQGAVRNSMFLQPVDAVELGNTILQLKNKSPGWDGICADPVKAACDCLVEPLLHIVNLSFIHGTFPDDLKVAQVVPLYKKGSPMELGNYRPISLLPLFSKVFEKLIHKRIMKFVEDNSILSPHQFGFQSGKNTSMALISAVHKIVEVLEEGHVALGVLLDFQKAFDTVQHNILVRKLNKYGIRGAPLDLITSYLSGRHQRVLYNGTLSEYKLVTCGVPQ